MDVLKLKIYHYLNCESHIHLGVLRKTNAKSEHNFGRFVELYHVKADSHVSV